MKALVHKLPAILLTGALFLLILYSCNKDPYEIGYDLLPPTDTLHVLTTDTCTIEAFSVRVDSVRTDQSSILQVGSINDPVFGKITSSFYSHLRLSSEEVNFGDRPVLDSLVLVLFYNSYYGDTLTRQNLKVYEVSDNYFTLDSAFFSNQQLQTYPQLLANHDFYPRPTDSVKVYGVKTAPHIRINLSKFSNYLGNKILYAPEEALASNFEFTKFFKGLHVQASPVNAGGSLVTFSVSSATSKLVVYFHNGEDPTNDSLSYEMFINTGSARFVHVDHNNYLNASQDLKQQVLNHDSAKGVNQLFLQGLGGVKVKLKFPYMKDFGHGKIVAINDALLLMKNSDPDTTFAPPSSLTILRQDSVGRVGYLIDANEGSSYFGGTYNATSKTYFFRITQHMQTVLMDGYSNHFDLYMHVTNPVQSLIVPNRLMFYGTSPAMPGNISDRLRLKVTYTILN